MPGHRVAGPLCCTTSHAIDTGTNARTRSPSPRPICVFNGTPTRKASSGHHGSSAGHALIIQKARTEARAMLTTRLGDLDAWERECVRRSRQGKVNEPLTYTCEATRKLFVGWLGTDDAVAWST